MGKGLFNLVSFIIMFLILSAGLYIFYLQQSYKSLKTDSYNLELIVNQLPYIPIENGKSIRYAYTQLNTYLNQLVKENSLSKADHNNIITGVYSGMELIYYLIYGEIIVWNDYLENYYYNKNGD